MRLHRPSILSTVLLLVLVGCRSTAPEPPAPIVASPGAEAADNNLAPQPTPLATTEVVATDDLGPEASSESQFVADLDLVEDVPVEEEKGPEALQRWALELCQTAEQLLEEGDNEGALAALDQAYELMLQLPANEDYEYLQAREDIRLLVADLIQRHHRAGRVADGRPAVSWDLELPMVDNESVRYEIKRFTGVEREAFLEGYRRSGRYRPMILPKLEEAGLPSQLSWLPMVESWFKVRAYSRASAVGMWQFISSTGQRYGLTRDGWIDERYDSVKSTDAAIGYLTDLHSMFGDWPKALAGYNCGEARVARLQRQSQSDYMDFWDMYELLPRETRRYVPRLYAAIAIIEDPEKYGMVLPKPDAPYDLAAVTVEKPVKLEQLDALLGLDKGTLAGHNPELRHKGTPPRAYELQVPVAHEKSLVAGIESLPEWKPQQVQHTGHRVRRGQTLSTIARRYGTSVNAIMQANNLRSAHRIREGQNLRIPGRGSGSVAQVSRNATNGVHTVRRGETLGAIAQAYGSSVNKIKADNGLSSNMIHPGQQLRVSGTASSSTTTTRAGSGPGSYKVRSGDTPGSIAERHGVGLSALLRANNLGQSSTIYPGQKLVIP